MTRYLFVITFLLGAAGVAWVGAGFVGNSLLALAMTAIIGAIYGYGAFELRQFRQATSRLASALTAVPDDLSTLGDWLGKVPASLQNAVRLRIEGERVGLPGPVLTPYLVGLLVMLGMLGTFLGMVVTLNGAVFALEKTTDLDAIRSALAMPIKGLGLAFGTSVAGVAASAMLGLMSALCRRERLAAAQLLDSRIATGLRRFSLTHQRQETLKALESQAQIMPAVLDRLQAMMVQMEAMNRQLGQELGARLIGNQDGFHTEVRRVYTDLATAVDHSLRESLRHSAQLTADSIKPVVEAAMCAITGEATQTHARLADAVQLQLDGVATHFGATAATVAATWTAALASHEQTSDRLVSGLDASLAKFNQTFAQRADALVTGAEASMRSRIAAEAQWIEQHGQRMDDLAGLLRSELGALREQEAVRGNAAVERLGQLQTALANHLTTLGTALEAPLTRLIEMASEVPRAAAEVIGQLRQEISSSVARDNELLDERTRILETLNGLLDAINHASVEQRRVIDSLVASSAVALTSAGSAFADNIAAEGIRLADIAAHVTSSAVDVSSLSEAFGFAVHSFNEANDKLIANLQRIEGAMDKSMARSDEQLAYYVAQAREIIELSMSSHKEIFEELRQLPGQSALAEGSR
ncbi:MAG: DUF802 domain-containing protein [Herminiimonas sp.]|nr:DUF802 domain-containing protein [Herminiimonas sp.]